MTSYWRSIVTTALSRAVCEIVNVEKYRDLEIGVRGHSRSLKVVFLYRCPINSLCPRAPAVRNLGGTCPRQLYGAHDSDYQTWANMQKCVYQTDVHSVDELKQWLNQFRCTLDPDIIDTAIDQLLCKRIRACVHAKAAVILSTSCELTQLPHDLLFDCFAQIIRTLLHRNAWVTLIFSALLFYFYYLRQRNECGMVNFITDTSADHFWFERWKIVRIKRNQTYRKNISGLGFLASRTLC